MSISQTGMISVAQEKCNNIAKNNRDAIYETFALNLMFVKIDKVTDHVRKNYSIKLYGLPHSEILSFLTSSVDRLEFFTDECPYTLEKEGVYKEIIYIRFDHEEKSLYLDFYAY